MLTTEEQQQLEVAQEILELRSNPAWKLWQETVLRKDLEKLERRLKDEKQPSWEHYLALWYSKEKVKLVLGSLDRLEIGVKALEKKALEKPDHSPATGSLA